MASLTSSGLDLDDSTPEVATKKLSLSDQREYFYRKEGEFLRSAQKLSAKFVTDIEECVKDLNDPDKAKAKLMSMKKVMTEMRKKMTERNSSLTAMKQTEKAEKSEHDQKKLPANLNSARTATETEAGETEQELPQEQIGDDLQGDEPTGQVDTRDPVAAALIAAGCPPHTWGTATATTATEKDNNDSRNPSTSAKKRKGKKSTAGRGRKRFKQQDTASV